MSQRLKLEVQSNRELVARRHAIITATPTSIFFVHSLPMAMGMVSFPTNLSPCMSLISINTALKKAMLKAKARATAMGARGWGSFKIKGNRAVVRAQAIPRNISFVPAKRSRLLCLRSWETLSGRTWIRKARAKKTLDRKTIRKT